MTTAGMALDVGTALVAVQAVSERLQLMRSRAAVDARYRPEVARLEGAREALDAAINTALTQSTTR